MAALPVAGWMCEGELHVEFQKTMVDFEHGYKTSTDSAVCKKEQSKLLESCFMRDMPKPLSLTSGRASALFPMSLRRGIGAGGMLE